MRAGFTVVILCLIASGLIGYGFYRKYKPELAQTQDVVTALIYFLEAHDGRFPASEAELRACSFVENLPGGGLRVRAPESTRYRRDPYGIPIASLEPFRIAWGTQFESLTLDEYGKARNADGRKVELVCWPSSPPSGKGYTWILLDVAQECRARAAASAPAAETTVDSRPTAP